MNTEIPDTKWTAPGCDVPFTIAYKNCMVYAGCQLCAIEDALGTQHNACKPSWKTVSVNLAAKSDRANAIRLYMSNYKEHLPSRTIRLSTTHAREMSRQASKNTIKPLVADTLIILGDKIRSHLSI